MHTGLLTVNGEKMAKSLGNYVRVRDVLQEFSPEAVRLFILSAHYRSQLDYRREKMEEAEASVRRLIGILERVEEAFAEKSYEGSSSLEERSLLEELKRLSMEFDKAMDDDFNTAEALSYLYAMSRVMNKMLDLPRINRSILEESRDIFSAKLRILGLPDKPARRRISDKLLEELLKIIVDIRSEARRRKDYAIADEIRRRLALIGIKLEDLPDRTIWRFE